MKNPLLPRQADNNHNLSKVIIVVFALMTMMTIGRSLAHVFLPDGGAHSIATIVSFDGSPDPDAVIFSIFALWGLAQLAMGVVYVIVLLRSVNLFKLTRDIHPRRARHAVLTRRAGHQDTFPKRFGE